jgi:hypothetical protein
MAEGKPRLHLKIHRLRAQKLLGEASFRPFRETGGEGQMMTCHHGPVDRKVLKNQILIGKRGGDRSQGAKADRRGGPNKAEALGPGPIPQPGLRVIKT